MSLLAILMLTNYNCKKRKPVNPVNKVVNVQFVPSPVNQGPCVINSTFFIK